jgi:hypothetical protein
MQTGTYEEGNSGSRAVTVLEPTSSSRGEMPQAEAFGRVPGIANAREKSAIVGLRLAMPLALLLWALVATALWSMLR